MSRKLKVHGVGIGEIWVCGSGMNALSRDREAMGGADGMAVAVDFLARLPYGNPFQPVDPRELAKRLRIGRKRIELILAGLVEAGFLLARKDQGDSETSYAVSPEFAWRGDSRSHAEALAELREGRNRQGAIREDEGRRRSR